MKKSMIWPRSNLDLYVTVSPCGPCLTEIEVDIRIRRIFYCHEYRDVGHLWACKLEVYKVTPAGYITRFADNQKRLVDPESLYD